MAQVMQTRYTVHYWKSKDEHINNFLLLQTNKGLHISALYRQRKDIGGGRKLTFEDDDIYAHKYFVESSDA